LWPSSSFDFGSKLKEAGGAFRQWKSKSVELFSSTTADSAAV